MPMWTCDFAACGKPSVRILGECALCNRHLCSEHLQHAYHRCPKWEDADAYDPAAREAEASELAVLIKKINTQALASRASYLRQGMPCSIPPLQYDWSTRNSVMGGMNYHIEVCFDDGVKWIARIRRFNATSPPAALRDFIVRSEVATLKFLEQTNVPAPKVFDFGFEDSDHAIGVGYILMEKLPGKSLNWCFPDQQQKNKVMDQLANMFIELRKYPFDLLGSLDRPGEPHVGGFAREYLTDFTQSGMRTMGPFSSEEECRRRSLELILDLILREEMYSDRAVDAYLLHRFLIDLLPYVLPSSAQQEQQKQQYNDDVDGDTQRHHYYLKHADDKGDHILIDDDYNFTGIIDWEWAHTAPPAVAFNSPLGLLPVGKFYKGAINIGEDEVIFARLLEDKGHPELAGYVRNGRLQHQFAFLCGYDLNDWVGFLGLFQGLRNAVKVDDQVDWDGWRRGALKRYEEDAGLQLLLSRHGETSS
ncbi:hypothetical protein F4778DRAFT_734090 [Xylariomycetidae sp. FL2044]|nr:hypothetical protein F4778DRAFT_734090 [Xylariomycetidae sp. FL2044]